MYGMEILRTIMEKETMSIKPKELRKVLYDIMEKDSAIAVAGSVRIINYLGEKAFENYGADLIRGYQIVSRAD
jgi:hypothetical protein